MNLSKKFKLLFEHYSNEYNPPQFFDQFGEGLRFDEIETDVITYKVFEKHPEAPFEIKASDKAGYVIITDFFEKEDLRQLDLDCDTFTPDDKWSEIERIQGLEVDYTVYEQVIDSARIQITIDLDQKILSTSIADVCLIEKLISDTTAADTSNKGDEIWGNASQLNQALNGETWLRESMRRKKGWEEAFVRKISMTPNQIEFIDEWEYLGERFKEVYPPSQLRGKAVNTYEISVRSIDEDKIIVRRITSDEDPTVEGYWFFQIEENRVGELADDLIAREYYNRVTAEA